MTFRPGGPVPHSSSGVGSAWLYAAHLQVMVNDSDEMTRHIDAALALARSHTRRPSAPVPGWDLLVDEGAAPAARHAPACAEVIDLAAYRRARSHGHGPSLAGA